MPRRQLGWRSTKGLFFVDTSTFVDLPLPDWLTLRRLRTEGGCPQPVPGQNLTYTVICEIQADGSYGHAICGFVGRLSDLSRFHWFWDGYIPWTAATTNFTTALGTSQSWAIPPDWNSLNNQVEAIGPGGANITGSSGACTGGGGGAYAITTNLTLTAGGSTVYTIAAATDTMFVDTSTLLAKCGAVATFTSTPSAGGAAASCVPSTGAFSGGAGAGLGGGGGPGGGGGAAGSSGIGKDGAVTSGSAGGGGGGANGGSSTNATAGAGGAGRTGIAGGAAGSNGVAAAALSGAGGGGGTGTNGGDGGSGVPIWTQSSNNATAGSGGGGGGTASNNAATGGVGGAYGGGAGGRYNAGSVSSGGQGIIVASYIPFFGSKPMRSRAFLTR